MKQSVRPISIAVAALGGQGGGVLAQWIVDMAESNGYRAQYTSVPGVAQRTGATIYFVELFPESAITESGRTPILALMPAPGDVDIVVAAELMEAGRAITRGIVSPDLTTLIASDHRVYAISEKEIMGDGRADDDRVREAAKTAAKRLVLFDMDAAAEATGSVISSILFGALAGSEALPFPRSAYEDVIKHTGKAVATNLAGFARGYDGAQASLPAKPVTVSAQPTVTDARIAALPQPVQAIASEGVKRLVDYQDRAYADLYLDRVESVVAAAGSRDDSHRLSVEAARYLALWMGFEDVIRVADLKTRPDRMDRIRQEVRAKSDQIFYVVEFFHPRFEEFCDTLPAPLGRAVLKSKFWRKVTAPLFAEGRNIQTAKLSGFVPLFFLARLRFMRRWSLRFHHENAMIEAWLDRLITTAQTDYDVAAELAELPRLIKGYGDTHERGIARYNQIVALLPLSAGDVRNLREAALKDEEGQAFAAALQALPQVVLPPPAAPTTTAATAKVA